MEHAIDMGADWRETASEILESMGYFPLDITQLDNEYRDRYGNIDRVIHDKHGNLPDHKAMLQRKANIRKHFIRADLELIKHDTDALLVYYDESARRGAGTISECQVAYLYDIPIFVVCGYDNWQTEVPGWLFGLSTKIFASFIEAYAYFDALPPGVLTKDIYDNRGSDSHYVCSLSGDVFSKEKTHFVSKVSPLYSSASVDLIKTTNEQFQDRYEFFTEFLQDVVLNELRNQ
jgi:hypothetical protein